MKCYLAAAGEWGRTVKVCTDADELPEGWTEAALKDVATMRLGKLLDAAKQSTAKPLPYLRNINVRWEK